MVNSNVKKVQWFDGEKMNTRELGGDIWGISHYPREDDKCVILYNNNKPTEEIRSPYMTIYY